jgi:hypothetical protein
VAGIVKGFQHTPVEHGNRIVEGARPVGPASVLMSPPKGVCRSLIFGEA